MDKKLRTAIVGLGRIGFQLHLPSAASHDGFIPCAVVDVSTERLQEAKDKFGVTGYTSLTEMLASEHPDLVVIASPTHLHMEQTIEAMEADCDVFLDKPMAKNLEEVEKIVEAKNRTGRKLMIFQPHRVRPETNVLRQIISSGILGEIFMYKRANCSYTRRCDWQSLRRFGGGMLNNYGAHYLDQALYILGSNGRSASVKNVNCIRQKILSLGDAEDVVKILAQTDKHITVDIDINECTSQSLEPFTVCGKNGAVVMRTKEDGSTVFEVKYVDPADLKKLELSDSLAAAGRKYSQEDPIPWKLREYPILPEHETNFYDHCYDYYALDKAPIVPLEDTVELMRLLEVCRDMSQSDFDESIGYKCE